MTLTKRILTAMTAAALTVSSVPAAVSVTSFAATEVYKSSDIVEESYFYYTGASQEIRDALKKVFETATKKDIRSITYADLERITSLNLSGMKLEGVPKAIEYMVRLRTLNLSNNRLRSVDLNKVDLSGCVNLTTLDLSRNYITSIPSWYVSMDVATKRITDNLLDGDDQRSIVSVPSVFYFMDGDTVNENKLKNKILSSIKLSDGSDMPTFFFDPEDLPYDEEDPFNTGIISQEDHILEIDKWDISKYLKKKDDGEYTVVADKAYSTDITIRLYYGTNSSSNRNTTCTVKLYFLNGSDPSSMNVRLETLIAECQAISKTDYTANSWLNFEAALKTAEAIKGYTSADADMIKSALEDLENAKTALVKGVDTNTKKLLNDLIAISKNRNEADYTPASWSAFASAVERMQKAADSADVSITEANAAIKAYQDAQAGLVATSLSVPATVTKEEFDAVYGENKNLTYNGTTREGYKYSWLFNGKDIVEPKAFNPEIKYQSDYEEAIRYEVGSASDYQLISFAEKGEFPGAAMVTLDVSGKYTNGTYRLYKWNTTTKKSEFIENVSIKDGIVSLSLKEGGEYFISSVLQNFNMISNIFEIDNSKLTISCGFKSRNTVAGFKNSLENGDAVTVRNTDGSVADDTINVATGMTATAANSDVAYTIIVTGDVTGDGAVTAMDAVDILRAVIGEITLDTYAQKSAGDVNGDGWVRADDAVAILKYSIGME